MLTGKSVWHVNQEIGKCIAKGEVSGYYNNMTEKVMKIPELLDGDELPKLNLEGGKFTYFPCGYLSVWFWLLRLVSSDKG